MNRYHFHLKSGSELVEDEEGIELPDLSAAREVALDDLRSLVAEAVKDGSDLSADALIIHAAGRDLVAVPVTAILPPLLVEKLCPAGSKVPMDRFDEYRRHAAECRGMAENALAQEDKQEWLKLADSWLQMLPKRGSQSEQGWPKPSEENSHASH